MKKGYVDIEKKKRENLEKLIKGDRSRVEKNKRKIYEGKLKEMLKEICSVRDD